MNILLVLAHPEPKSFNAALHRAALSFFEDKGHQVVTSDLYRMGFSPVSDASNFTQPRHSDHLQLQQEERWASLNNGFTREITEEMEKVSACDLMIWQFPLWWFSVPAILKGWIDKVFANGFAYGGGKKYATGQFAGKRAMLSTTTGANESAYKDDGFQGEIDKILWPLHRGVFQFTGFEVLPAHVIYDPQNQSNNALHQALLNYQRRLASIL